MNADEIRKNIDEQIARQKAERANANAHEQEPPPHPGPHEQDHNRHSAPELEFIDLHDWQENEPSEQRWIVEDIIPEGNVTLLSGDGGLGKSLIACQLLAACPIGGLWLGRETRNCKTMGIFCEDGDPVLHRRFSTVLNSHGARFDDLLGRMALRSRVGENNFLFSYQDLYSLGKPTDFFEQIKIAVEKFEPQLLVLDSLHDFFCGNEIHRPHAHQFVNELRKMAMAMRGAVLLNLHPSLSGRRSGTGESGSRGWGNTGRSRLYLTAPKQDGENSDRDYRELEVKKANYGPTGIKIRMRWERGLFVAEQDQPRPTGTVEKIQLDNAIVDVARDLIKNGVRVLANKNAPNSLANRVREDDRCKAFKWSDVAAAQERMITSGRLARVELGPPSRRMVYVRPSDVRYPGEANISEAMES